MEKDTSYLHTIHILLNKLKRKADENLLYLVSYIVSVLTMSIDIYELSYKNQLAYL